MEGGREEGLCMYCDHMPVIAMRRPNVLFGSWRI